MFEHYTRLVIRHRWAVALATAVVTVLLGIQASALRSDIREDAALPKHHPFVQLDQEIHRLFRGHKMLVIGLMVHEGTIYTPATLAKIVRITRAVERLPGVVSEAIFSLASSPVKNLRATGDTLDLAPFLGRAPEDAAGLARLRADVEAHPMYVGYLVSADATAAAIVADFRDLVRDPELHAAVERIVAPECDATTSIVLGGVPIVLSEIDSYTGRMAVLFPIAVLVIGLIHYHAFGTIQAMVLPLLTALISVVWALGIMAALGYPIDTWSAITPVLILAIAAGHAVQILKRYYEEFARLGDSHEAIVAALAKVGPVMVTAGLIAAAGFASLATFDIPSVRVFGLLLTFGILSALTIELTFIPAFRALLPAPRERETIAEARTDRLDALLARLATAICDRPRCIVGTAVALAAIACSGVGWLRVDNSIKTWFSADSQLRLDEAALNRVFAGTSTFKVLISGSVPDAVIDPAVMRAIDGFERDLEALPSVGKAISFVDQLKVLNQVVNDGDPAEFVVPPERDRAAQFLLFFGPNDLAATLDADRQHALVLALARSDTAAFGTALVAQTRALADLRFAGLPVSVGVAGGSIGVQTAMNSIIVREKLRNMVQVAAIIFVLASLVLRSLVGGLMVLVPLATATLANLGLMGWSGTWLSMGTAAITAMAVSIGADFAIYFLFRFREELGTTSDVRAALERSLATAGKAVIFVSSAVALGYTVLALAGFALWTYLGVLTALMVAFASAATITMLPALVILVQPRFAFRVVTILPAPKEPPLERVA